MPRAWCAIVLCCLSLAGPAPAQHPSPLRKQFVDKAPPELVADKEQWLAGQPVALRSLHGRVVWPQFNF
jgi:hypothetical protein